MKGIIGKLSALTVLIGATVYTTQKYRDYIERRESEAIYERLLAEKGSVELEFAPAEDAEPYTAHFDVGDPVIIRNPYLAELTEHDVRHTRITERGQIEETGVYIYRVEGDTQWYNEAYLAEDYYGPKTLNVVPITEATEAPPTIDAQIDAVLDEINDNNALIKTFGDAEYLEKGRQLSVKLAGRRAPNATQTTENSRLA